MKYIALLRGINVGGKNKIAMDKLKNVFQDKNYKNVQTYLNSGNVIFECDCKSKLTLMQDVKEIIKNKFNLDIPVFILTVGELEAVFNHSPIWWNTADKNVYDNLICIIPPATYNEIYDTVGQQSKDIEKIESYCEFIFWSFDLKKYRKSNWWVKTASTSIKDKITIRTANTMKKLLELSKK